MSSLPCQSAPSSAAYQRRTVQLMGILNVTPDSFSDGGALPDVTAALQQASLLVQAGASILDVGGESTRPDAAPVSAALELQRVLPVLEALYNASQQQHWQVTLSIDTSKAAVAAAALQAGATLVNDVSALRDPQMAELIARQGAHVILMHMRGTPRTMQQQAVYSDVLQSVCHSLQAARATALAAGIAPSRICLDPGLGFGKTLQHNLQLVHGLPQLCALGHPVVIGASRKAFLGALLPHTTHPKQRDAATAALCALAIYNGATILRVHNVQAMQAAVAVATALQQIRTELPAGS